MLVRDVLAAKGDRVWTIQAAQTLQDALRMLITKKIGALMILDEKNRVAGILSERDILRECDKHPEAWFDFRIHAVMSRVLRVVRPQANLKLVMEMMTENRIRHIPVMEGEKLSGIISIGDVVKSLFEHTETENQHMREYINGT